MTFLRSKLLYLLTISTMPIIQCAAILGPIMSHVLMEGGRTIKSQARWVDGGAEGHDTYWPAHPPIGNSPSATHSGHDTWWNLPTLPWTCHFVPPTLPWTQLLEIKHIIEIITILIYIKNSNSYSPPYLNEKSLDNK